MKILVAGYQHETNTFAPTKADWAAFNRGDDFPAFAHGQAMLDKLTGVNLPIGGFIDAAKARGWQLVPSSWCGASPSSYVTQDAFERMSASVMADVIKGGFDAVYLDLHGAGVAEHVDDTEGELIARIRKLVGPDLPIVASLDLHANVTQRMLQQADALVSYRTYPHIDMAATGELAAQLLARRIKLGRKEALRYRRLPFLIPLNAQSTWLQPAAALYNALPELDKHFGTCLSFCMAFPASDFDECGPMVWAHGEHAAEAVDRLYAQVAEPTQWKLEFLSAHDAVAQSLARAAQTSKPLVIADTQDNPGAGGDSNTTGLLHALLQQDAGKKFPGQIALGLMFDPQAAQAAAAAGVGAIISITLGTAVPTFTGQASDPPVYSQFKVRAVGDGVVTLKGRMMTGHTAQLGPCACLEVDGILVAVASGQIQMLDRELFRMVGIEPEAMKIIVVKSSNHFRADFTPLVANPETDVIVAKAAGPMAADPADLPWKNLPASTRRTP
ncbi:MAG: M81 family metallopeptidase [Polaromonas sp.]|uniref:M81 family metallopeptidase n=1 Tax=Polaromonas sp. TaxID=1869339 RepID=UPI0027328D5D|nr:M81 family metallopeptidase [Polaromonas sp.]MDP2817769.1 M81 family metallopeptidase [Polaromonas sp.]